MNLLKQNSYILVSPCTGNPEQRSKYLKYDGELGEMEELSYHETAQIRSGMAGINPGMPLQRTYH